MMARKREPIQPRIRRTTKQDGECWMWMGCQSGDGYGVMTVGRRQVRAHRASYEAFIGEIPRGVLVCHSCDRPLCVNPKHLFLGTPRDNTRDMLAKGRAARLRGIDHPNTKIDPKERPRIRKLRSDGWSLKSLASKYGVSFQTISAICSGARSYAAG